MALTTAERVHELRNWAHALKGYDTPQANKLFAAANVWAEVERLAQVWAEIEGIEL